MFSHGSATHEAHDFLKGARRDPNGEGRGESLGETLVEHRMHRINAFLSQLVPSSDHTCDPTMRVHTAVHVYFLPGCLLTDMRACHRVSLRSPNGDGFSKERQRPACLPGGQTLFTARPLLGGTWRRQPPLRALGSFSSLHRKAHASGYGLIPFPLHLSQQLHCPAHVKHLVGLV